MATTGAARFRAGARWRAAVLPWLLLVAPAVAGAPPAWLEHARTLADRDPQAALALADQALVTAEAGGDAALLEARLARASLFRQLGRYGDAVIELDAALAQASDAAQAARAHAALGSVFAMSGMYADALEHLQSALSTYQAQGNWARATAMLNNLGNVFAEQGDADAAREYYARALTMKREHGIDDSIGGLLNNLGDLDRETGQPLAARRHLEEAVRISVLDGDPARESMARGNLGRVLVQLGEFREALDEIERAEHLAAGGEVRLQAAAWLARAEAYLGLARAEPAAQALRGQRLQRALDAITRAEEIASGIDEPRRRARIAALASEIHAELGQPADALAQLRRSAEFQHQHERRADASRQAVLAARFQHAQHRSQIAELRERDLRQQATLQRQRTLAWLLGGTGLALAALAALLLRQVLQRRRHGRELSDRNVELGDALLDAEEQRSRAERLATLNRQLLALAGNDLRGPALRIRSMAERALVDRGGGERQIATIAQAAGELMRVVDQINDMAAPVARADGGSSRCNLATLLRNVIEHVDARVLGRDRRLGLEVSGDCRARVDGRGLERVLHEILDAVLHANRGHAALVVGCARIGDSIDLRIDDPGGDIVGGINAGEAGIGLAFATKVLRELGGQLRGETHRTPPQLVIRLPAVVDEVEGPA